jgi:glucan 1,3-beta-glucosidase
MIASYILCAALFSLVNAQCDYWYETTKHNSTSFRNVKDPQWGAKGDGITDDTAALINALTSGRNNGCSVATPLAIYLPAGTYLITGTLPHYFNTELIGNGNPNPGCRSTIYLKNNTFANRVYMIEGTVGGNNDHVSNFYHGIVNVDLVVGSGNPNVVALHWAVAQATHLRNITANLGSADSFMFVENGGGGLMSDLTIIGGNRCIDLGSQQWTLRNIQCLDQKLIGFNLFWDWAFILQGVYVRSQTATCIVFTGTDGSLVLLDSVLQDCPVGVSVDYATDKTKLRGVLVDRVTFNNVKMAVNNTLPGAANQELFVQSWYQGYMYASGTVTGKPFGNLTPTRPNVPLPNRARPNVGSDGTVPLNVLDYGAKGDGVTDDTAAIQAAINAGNVVFLPFGFYVVSSTLTLHNNSVLLGENLSTFIAKANAPAFSNAAQPTPLILTPQGASTVVFLIDLIFTAGSDLPGLVMIDWQAGSNSGVWDVHYRLYYTIAQNWVIHNSGAGGYFENVWLWTADHAIDPQPGGELNVTNPNGLLIENNAPGAVYLIGTASEHAWNYQYNLSGASDVYIVMAQTETNYNQYPQSGWALTVSNSNNIYVYGTGFYAWGAASFNEGMQYSLIDVGATNDLNSMYFYNINTYGANMIMTGYRNILNNTDDWFCSNIIAMQPF